MKKFIFTASLLILAAPVFADDVNMTPQNAFSGYTNSATKTTYPRLIKPLSASDIMDERSEIMRPKSVREMGNTTPRNDGTTPMTYNQFPQNYDSSNMMLMQGVRNGMQNMLMGF